MRMPVAYIHYTVDGEKTEARKFSPSTAMVFVRKYLEDKLKDHPTVEFQTLGPSPFHADILLGGPEVDSTGYTDPAESEDLTKVGDGYRTLFFTIPGTGEEKVFRFVGEHQAILAAYYSIIRLRNYGRSLRTAVFDGASDLLDDRHEHSSWAKFM
jgi:hypothetical protein